MHATAKRRQENALDPSLRSRPWRGPTARLFLVVGVPVFLAIPVGWALDAVSPEDAINHVGQHATVCGTVASANYATGSNGQPTFLNLDRPYPAHVFAALIWGEDRSKFSYPPESLQGKDICVEGLIESYKGTAETVVDDPSQITIQ